MSRGYHLTRGYCLSGSCLLPPTGYRLPPRYNAPVTVIVIGAGIIGLSIAYELASRGARVLLLEGRGIGQGATQASAGILAPHIEGHSRALLQLGVASLALYDDFVARASRDSGRSVELERSGTLQVALSSEDAQQLASLAGVLAANAVSHSVLDADSVRRIDPAITNAAVGALLVRDHGYVAAMPLAEVLIEAARSRGAALVAARAQEIRVETNRVRVRTAESMLAADAVVIAAGSWSPDLEREIDVKPIRGQLLHLRLAERAASRVIWGPRCYIVPWRDGSVLVGATVEDVGFDERATAGGVHQLADAAVELVPRLADAAFEGVRVGLRPLVSGELPVLGRSAESPRIFHALGHYRNGVLMAPLTARLIADLVLDGREGPELALLAGAGARA